VTQQRWLNLKKANSPHACCFSCTHLLISFFCWMPKMDSRWIKDTSEVTGHVSSTSKKIIKLKIAASMATFFDKKSLCSPANTICEVLAKVCTGSADWGSFVGILHAGGLFMPSFFREGRRGGAAAGREQATNIHSGTFRDPDATPGKHRSLHSLEQFQNYICIYRLNATLGIRFPKNRCSSFLLVQN